MELTRILADNPDFAHLSPGDLEVLEGAFKVEAFPCDADGTGHEFTREGTRPHAAWLILEGEVAVTRASDPLQDEISRLRRGDMFGLVALVTEDRRSATCRAVGPVRVARIEASAFDWILRDHAPLGLALQRAVARQLAADFRKINARVCAMLEKQRS